MVRLFVFGEILRVEMDTLPIIRIVSFLTFKGFNLKAANLEYLRFEKQINDTYSEIEILISSIALWVKLKSYNTIQFYKATDFDDLKSLLESEIK